MVQVVGAAQLLSVCAGAGVAVEDGGVEGDDVVPFAGVAVADGPPLGVAVERARYCEYLVTITRSFPVCPARACRGGHHRCMDCGSWSVQPDGVGTLALLLSPLIDKIEAVVADRDAR